MLSCHYFYLHSTSGHAPAEERRCPMRFGLGIVQAHVFVDVDNASVPLEGDGFEPSVPE
jgi:hypothetical protein